MQPSLPPRQRNTTLLVALGAALLAVAVLITVLLVDRGSSVGGTAVAAASGGPTTGFAPPGGVLGRAPGGAHAQVGDCVKFNAPRLVDNLAEEVDCTAPDAVYQVGYRDERTTGTCPTQSYDQYIQTGPDGNFMLCLMMNGEAGECFAGYSTRDEFKTKVDCSKADTKVSKRLDDRVDPSACPPSSGWQLIYPQQHRTICLDPLHNT